MYLDFYNLRAEPFHITSDPAFLYLSPSHKEALGAIIYGISHRKGFVAISGEVGMGKTTILRAYLEGADLPGERDAQKVIYIFNANISFHGLLHTLCKELDRIPPAGEVYEVVNFLHAVLIQEYQQGQTVVFVIDEAQNMPVETLENLRMLSNLETSQEKLIQIILVGQPEFDSMLKLPQLRQLDQRIAIRAHIQALTRKESIAYIYHRLSRVTDTPNTVFSPSAIRLIARQGRGVPRILNILSDNALIAGFGYQKKPVTLAIAREAIADYRGRRQSKRLQWAVTVSALGAISIGLMLSPAGTRLSPHLQLLAQNLRIRMETGYLALRPEPNIPLISSAPLVVTNPMPLEDLAAKNDPATSDVKLPITQAFEKRPDGFPQTGFQPSIVLPAPENSDTGSLLKKMADAPEQQIRRVIQKGESLIQIAQAVYGRSDPGTLEWIVTQNPQILNPNRLLAGDSLLLPSRP